MVSVRINSSAFVLIGAILLIILAVFTRQGNETFNKVSSMFGDLSKEILLVVVVLLLVMMIINIYNIDMNIDRNAGRSGTQSRTLVVEGLDFLNSDDNDGSRSFCEKYQSDLTVLDKKCQKFNEDSCNVPSCCVWLNGEKCVSGGVAGPTFKADKNDKDIEINYYYHQGKCYGNSCPKFKL